MKKKPVAGQLAIGTHTHTHTHTHTGQQADLANSKVAQTPGGHPHASTLQALGLRWALEEKWEWHRSL
jgi:hypothetical protein